MIVKCSSLLAPERPLADGMEGGSIGTKGADCDKISRWWLKECRKKCEGNWRTRVPWRNMEVILNPEWLRQHTRRAHIQLLKLRAQRNLHHCSAIGGSKNRFPLIVLSSQTRRWPQSCAPWKHWVRFLHARRYWRCWCYKTAHKGILWDDDLEWVFLELTKLESGMAGLAHEAARQKWPSRGPINKVRLDDDSLSDGPSCEDTGNGGVLRNVKHRFKLFRTDIGAQFHNCIGPDAHCPRSIVAIVTLAKPG